MNSSLTWFKSKNQLAIFISSTIFLAVGLAFLITLSIPYVYGDTESAPGRSMEKKAGIKVGSNNRDQDDFEIFIDDPAVFFANTPERVSYSWSFVPDEIERQGPIAIKEYVYDKHFAFRLDARNFLIVDDSIVPRGKMKIALVQWNCTTDDCDTYGEMSDPVFLPFGDFNRGDFRRGYTKEKGL